MGHRFSGRIKLNYLGGARFYPEENGEPAFFPSSQAIIIVIYIHIASSGCRYCMKHCTNSAMAPLILT